MLAHDTAGRLEHVRVALQVHAEHEVDFLVGVVQQGLSHIDRRRAHHDVERASLGGDGFEGRGDGGAVDDIDQSGVGFAAGLADRRRRFRRCVQLHIEATHVRALLGASDRDGLTDS